MKTIRKMVCLVLALAMCFSCGVFASADGGTLTISTVTDAKPGDTVMVDVSVSAGLNAPIIQFAVNYDADKLEIASATVGSAVASSSPEINTNITGKVIFGWDTTGESINDAGPILNMTFTVKEGADGIANISIDTTEEFIFCDEDYNEISMEIVNGGVQIKAGKNAPTISHYGFSLSPLDALHCNYYVEINAGDYTEEYIKENGGMIVWDNKPAAEDATYEKATQTTGAYVVSGLKKGDGTLYAQQSEAIYAKNIRQTYCFMVFVKLEDGEYVYGDLKEYGVHTYCTNKLLPESTASSNLKALCTSILAYGDAANAYSLNPNA